MVIRFHTNGNTAKYGQGGGRPRFILPEEVEQYIRASLYENRFTSLRYRCSKILQLFGYKIEARQLTRIYKRMGITYQRTKTVYKASLKRQDFRLTERKLFARKLTSLMIQGKPIIFADESSYNLWTRPRINKTW
jgi:transposase